jgi:phage-related protein
MGQSYFIWNDMDCRSMGIILTGPAAIVRGEERVQHVTIPGRAGELTLTEGNNIFQSYIQTVTIHVRGGFRVREVQNWLKGSGEITFSGEPDRKQKARVIGAVTLDRHSKNMDTWSGEVQFYCEPFKESLRRSTVEVTSSGTAVTNEGDAMSRPKITATASGSSMVIAAGGNSLTVTGVTSGYQYIIDCDAQIVTTADGTTNLTANSSGPFPVLNKGSNTVTGSGWSKLVIDRRERFL